MGPSMSDLILFPYRSVAEVDAAAHHLPHPPEWDRPWSMSDLILFLIGQWRKWMLQLTTFLTHQNGTVHERFISDFL
jgi:hypothetical protein